VGVGAAEILGGLQEHFGPQIFGVNSGAVSVINISRSPLRISFFGGGTDYPTYFNNYPGAVLGASIDKYIYTIALPMADFAENRYRITYRIVEVADRVQVVNRAEDRSSLFDDRFLKTLEHLHMVSRKVFAGNLRAERRTRKVGSGIEFADHRTYARGDDFRYIDWNLYGRLDKLFNDDQKKQFKPINTAQDA
jgi:uncharacterized protein (DUF58 family)